MAFSIYTQSKIAITWQNFIKDATLYFEKINLIANKENISQKDKKKVKIMLEILLDEYKLLKPSKLLPKELKIKADRLYLKAKEIYAKVFRN